MPKRLLNGSELASFIKERQAKQVRMLRQAHNIVPRLLVLVDTAASEVIQVYVRMKDRYAHDIGVEMMVKKCTSSEMIDIIEHANADDSIQGIIVQLPLQNTADTDKIVQSIAPEKDVDGLLGERSDYISATAEAIDWLLNGYNIQLRDRKICIAGRGRLVGAPLYALWSKNGYLVECIDKSTQDKETYLRQADVVVTATGDSHSIVSENIKKDAVIVDAGTVAEDGVILGDVDDSVYDRKDVVITPKKGGVGPLTIVLLFDHLIRACINRT